MDAPRQAVDPSSPIAVEGTVRNSDDLRDQDMRLWQHGLHEDNIFVQRGNFFLVAESMFVVAYAALISASGSPNAITAARIIAGFGLAFALLWAYANHRQVRYLRVIGRRTYDAFPELRLTRDARPSGRLPSSTTMIAYLAPLLGSTMWIILGLVA